MSDTTIGLIVIAIVLAGAAAVWYFIIRPKKEKGIVTGLVDMGLNKTHFGGIKQYGKTPAGSPVWAVSQPSSAQLRNLDIGEQNQIARHLRAHPNWTNKNAPGSRAWVLVRQMDQTIDGQPALRAKGTKCSGFTMGVDPHTGPDRDYEVLPIESQGDWLMRSAWSESEHSSELYNDRAVFESFRGENDVHPHFDAPDIPVIPAV